MNLGTQLHIVQIPGSAAEDDQWGKALISWQSANAVSSETLRSGFCYSGHSVTHVSKSSSYHAEAPWIQFSSSYTFIKTMSSRREKNSAYPQFSFYVCSRLNEIAFPSVTFHCVTMSLGRESSYRKVRIWITRKILPSAMVNSMFIWAAWPVRFPFF